MSMFVADRERGLFLLSHGEERRVCGGEPVRLCACARGAFCALADGRALLVDGRTGAARGACLLPPGVEALCVSPSGGRLYALSSEADSVSALCALTGRLLLCAQAGAYPRDMRLHPSGALLAVAAGATGEILLLDSAQLTVSSRIAVPGVASAVTFWGGGLAFLCAVGEEEVSTLLGAVRAPGVQEELLRLPGLPGGLLAMPDGTLLVGSAYALTRVSPRKKTLWQAECGLPGRMALAGAHALVADPLLGQALCVPVARPYALRALYTGGEVADVAAVLT